MDFFCARRDACFVINTWSKFWRRRAKRSISAQVAAAANENATLEFQQQGGAEKEYQRGGKLKMANTKNAPLGAGTRAEIKVTRAFLMDFFCARRDARVAMGTWSKFWACKMVDRHV